MSGSTQDTEGFGEKKERKGWVSREMPRLINLSAFLSLDCYLHDPW